MLQSCINRAVSYCIHHFRGVMAAGLVLAAASAAYTDINNLLSAKLPRRQNEIAFQRDFPQTVELILVDVSASTPEAAKTDLCDQNAYQEKVN